MLKLLTNTNGVSGSENNIRNIIIEKMKPLCDSFEIDNMGNLIFYKKGTKGYHNKIMLTAHMDEVGFIVSNITEEGHLKFKSVGGIDPRIIQNSVVIINNNVTGVIGAKPAHMSKDDKASVAIDDLVIDIGCNSFEDASKFVNIGDYVAFKSEYIEFGDGLIKAKALDDRIGCFILTELAKKSYPNDIYFTFSVQEEVGCRGASILANKIKPDFSIVIEGTTCSDVPYCDEYNYSTKLGFGAALSMLDGGSYSDKDITELMYNCAVNNKIPVQYKRVTAGGNDASSIQVSGAGIKTAAISVPCRYIHSPVSVASNKDIKSCHDIIFKVLKEENELWSC